MEIGRSLKFMRCLREESNKESDSSCPSVRRPCWKRSEYDKCFISVSLWHTLNLANRNSYVPRNNVDLGKFPNKIGIEHFLDDCHQSH